MTDKITKSIILSIIILVVVYIASFIDADIRVNKKYENVLIDITTRIGVIDGAIKIDGDKYTRGISLTKMNGNGAIIIDSSQGEYYFARTVIHELAHIQFANADGCKLPIPKEDDHPDKTDCSERVAIWFEWYVFDRDTIEKTHPEVIEFFNNIYARE